MKRLVVALVAAVVVSGCASGGGGSGGATVTYADGTTKNASAGEVLCAILFFICLGTTDGSTGAATSAAPATGGSTSGASAAPPPQPFVRWQDHVGALTTLDSSDIKVGYDTSAGNTVRVRSGEAEGSVSTARVRTTSVEPISYWGNQQVTVIAENQPSLPGQPGLVSARGNLISEKTRFLDTEDPLTPSDYVERSATIGVIANPYEFGWDYQSFGIWATAISGRETIGASNFGAATPASAVPLTGAATFSGKLAGYYVSPGGQGSVAAADVTVAADFSARSLAISSTGTTLTRNLYTAVPASTLNLQGTMTYAPGASVFTGTLVNAGGTMSGPSSGQFYGPSAEELGGSFALRSTTTSEAFVGAYGAKR